jgi:D-alanyl-D-alanine carboxypeptidase/D-alanyl-D-alanine-endopeptidase (penicillin-binding protein 4)
VRGKVVAAFAVPVAVLVAGGGYVWADVEDRAPGWLTDEPPPPNPAPFLTAQAVAPGPGPSQPASALSDPGALGGAPMPSAAAIQALAEALRNDPRTGPSTTVAVVDLESGTVLAEVSATDPQVPASTTKVLTTISALHALGPHHTFATRAVYDPVRGELALVAGGDMMLAATAGHGGTVDEANGWAGLGDLADQAAESLKAAGATSVTVVYDDSAFPAPAVSPEWPAYVVRSGYGAPVTGLAVDIARTTPDFYAKRWPQPSANAAEVFAARLAERGIETRLGGARPGASGQVVGTVESAPLWLIVEHTLHDSDNTIAELLAREAARAGGDAASASAAGPAVVASLASAGIDTTGLEIYDGAGFSTRNRISANQLVNALRWSLTDPEARDFIDWLPIGAMEGTVANRFGGTPAAGLSRAKTGSLTGVTSLAGIVQTADGRVLAFAVLADSMPAGQDRPRAAIDEFVVAVSNCGCAT